MTPLTIRGLPLMKLAVTCDMKVASEKKSELVGGQCPHLAGLDGALRILEVHPCESDAFEMHVSVGRTRGFLSTGFLFGEGGRKHLSSHQAPRWPLRGSWGYQM